MFIKPKSSLFIKSIHKQYLRKQKHEDGQSKKDTCSFLEKITFHLSIDISNPKQYNTKC